jgi:hypothetical protein
MLLPMFPKAQHTSFKHGEEACTKWRHFFLSNLNKAGSISGCLFFLRSIARMNGRKVTLHNKIFFELAPVLLASSVATPVPRAFGLARLWVSA